MNRRFLVALAAVFAVWMVGDFLVHGVLLHEDYAALPELYRSEADAGRYFPLMLLAHLVMAGAFVWIYARGVEARPWLGQGVRYGVAVALLTSVPHYLIYFVVQPLPQALVVKQIAGGSLVAVVVGVLVAFLYRRD
jgi:hypothetical protein